MKSRRSAPGRRAIANHEASTCQSRFTRLPASFPTIASRIARDHCPPYEPVSHLMHPTFDSVGAVTPGGFRCVHSRRQIRCLAIQSTDLIGSGISVSSESTHQEWYAQQGKLYLSQTAYTTHGSTQDIKMASFIVETLSGTPQ